ncbi:MAG: hypothetical protein ABL962_02525 [Fimbriimonadaceae bacterium]
MNADVRMLVSDAERALIDGDHVLALATFVEAGDCSAQYGLWRGALRCYRQGLELDLGDPTAVLHAVRAATRFGRPIAVEWEEYAAALQRRRWWSFACRHAEAIIANRGSYVLCPGVGPVLALKGTDDDVFEATPIGRFVGMPIAMAMIILRRALFAFPRNQAATPLAMQVGYAQRRFVLDELGDWRCVA